MKRLDILVSCYFTYSKPAVTITTGKFFNKSAFSPFAHIDNSVFRAYMRKKHHHVERLATHRRVGGTKCLLKHARRWMNGRITHELLCWAHRLYIWPAYLYNTNGYNCQPLLRHGKNQMGWLVIGQKFKQVVGWKSLVLPRGRFLEAYTWLPNVAYTHSMERVTVPTAISMDWVNVWMVGAVDKTEVALITMTSNNRYPGGLIEDWLTLGNDQNFLFGKISQSRQILIEEN